MRPLRSAVVAPPIVDAGGKGRKGRWVRRKERRGEELASRERKRRRRATRVVKTPLKQLCVGSSEAVSVDNEWERDEKEEEGEEEERKCRSETHAFVSSST
jgi:hypothetical protein